MRTGVVMSPQEGIERVSKALSFRIASHSEMVNKE
jgi:hypothetical protein